MRRLFEIGLLFCVSLYASSAWSAEVYLETEAFANKGGWVVDTQFMDQLGSSYLLAHGLGTPVEDASTTASFPRSGEYHIWVRTYNWTSPWFDGPGAGAFQLLLNDTPQPETLGSCGPAWEWQPAGTVTLSKGENKITLHDLTGFDGRCDALYFNTNPKALPPNDPDKLANFRKTKLNLPRHPVNAGTYDLVVVGGGIAGISAAVSAARLGLSVALVQNRPLLGGNNSSDVRVHLGGRIEANPYHNLGNLQKEFGPSKGGNAKPAEQYEDAKKIQFVQSETNITLFLNYHVFGVKKHGADIQKVFARHTLDSREIALSAPLFADCTGDATLGFLSGADYRTGREAKTEFQESLAPDVADAMTMGASIQWYSVDAGTNAPFPIFQYGLDFNDTNAEKVTMGEWTWETGLQRNQIKEAERIRDYGMLVVYSNWSYLKNKYDTDNKYKNRVLGWVAYVAGKRESRRLMGDHILTENDIRNFVLYPDATGSTTWSIDLHYPDPKNTANFPGNEFKAIAIQNNINPYPVPYRCLYSRNVPNLFMAGRDISVTHVALGTTRVMRTCGIMGEVVGMAASLCKKHDIQPRDVYTSHLDELKDIMSQGVGKEVLPNNQTYNLGGTLGDHPSIKPIP